VHFEILVEDLSGKKALNILLSKMVGDSNTFTIHSYKGIGRIPKKGSAKLSKRVKRGFWVILPQLNELIQSQKRRFSETIKMIRSALLGSV